jgi:hypothetical protein
MKKLLSIVLMFGIVSMSTLAMGYHSDSPPAKEKVSAFGQDAELFTALEAGSIEIVLFDAPTPYVVSCQKPALNAENEVDAYLVVNNESRHKINALKQRGKDSYLKRARTEISKGYIYLKTHPPF